MNALQRMAARNKKQNIWTAISETEAQSLSGYIRHRLRKHMSNLKPIEIAFLNDMLGLLTEERQREYSQKQLKWLLAILDKTS